jgi:uncharacterized protein YceH (UPF0502 family)
MSELLLTPAEARVVAALVEKSITTPQYYPMTVNAIMLAANQKTARHPVMNLSEGEVGNTLTSLEERKLITRDTFSGRVQKWRHQFMAQLLLKPQVAALLVTLMLRGPQTLAELRVNAASVGGPGDPDALAQALQDLADRAQPMVQQLPRSPGQAALRYVHTLCGPVEGAASEFSIAAPALAAASGTPSRADLLETRIAALEKRLAALEQALGGPSG